MSFHANAILHLKSANREHLSLKLFFFSPVNIIENMQKVQQDPVVKETVDVGLIYSCGSDPYGACKSHIYDHGTW